MSFRIVLELTHGLERGSLARTCRFCIRRSCWA